MTGHRPFEELRDTLHATPEGHAAARRARLNLEIMLKLAQIREMRGMTQVEFRDPHQDVIIDPTDEQEDDRLWEETLANSDPKLSKLADKIRADIATDRTKPIDPDSL